MSHYLNLSAKTNRIAKMVHKTQKAKQNYWASDDVHRIAMRTPSLYETKPVPKTNFMTGIPFSGGQYE